MESKARATGYLCAAAMLALAVWIGGLLVHEAFHSARIIRVRFPELGTLMVQDPVAQDGVPVGRVRSLSLQNGFPLAEIELYRDGFVASDARFINFNHSLMGARMVVLTRGNSPLPLDESRVQEGIFADGVAESLRRVQDLLRTVAELRVQINELLSSPRSPLSPANFRRLEDDAQRIDQLAAKVDGMGASLQAGIGGWMQLETSLQTGFRAEVPAAQKTEQQTGALLVSALSAEGKADTLLASAEKLLASVQDSGGGLHALVYDPAAYEELKSSLNVVEEALRAYQDHGLSHVVRWRNVHLFRSKPSP